MQIRRTFAVAALLTVTPTLAPGVQAEVPPRTESGTCLEIPASHEALGKVYYVIYPAHSVQVTFTSDAPIERIIGTTNKVVGYLVGETRDGADTGRVLAGGFRLPVRSFDTGNELRNQHLQQQNFLDAGSFPDLLFEVTGSRDVSEISRDEHSTTYALTLSGALTVRDVTKRLEIPATVTVIPNSQITRNAGGGDIVALRCAYAVKRSELGVAPGFTSPELADEIRLDQALILSTASRDGRLRASPDAERLIQAQRFRSLISDLQDLDGAAELGRTLLERYWDDADAMNTLAWDAANVEHTDLRRFEFAEKAALRAAELDGENGDVLDTVAYVYWELSEVEKAVQWQRRAVEHRQSSRDPDELVDKLHRYERAAGLEPTKVAGMEVADLPQTSAIIAPFVGTYSIAEAGFEVVFIDDGGTLVARPGGQSPIKLLFQGGTEFRLSMRPAVKFIFDVEGDRAVGVTIHQGSREMKATREAG